MIAALERRERWFAGLTQASMWLVLATLAGVVVSLSWGAWPALKASGAQFFFSDAWDPANNQFGLLTALVGTLLTAGLALLIALPIGLAIAFFLSDIAGETARYWLGAAVEMLAAIPSIIYGMWGLFVLVPWLSENVQAPFAPALAEWPIVGALFKGAPLGIGIGTAALVLSLMVLPFLSATLRDLFLSVPKPLKESASGLGATRFEVFWNVVIPYCRAQAVGAVMLGLGRALGETMAVTFVIGNAHMLTVSLLSPGSTVASTIANEFNEASGELHTSALLALGLMLFLITFVVLALSRLLVASKKHR
jgi:phosphate transport system permease protein